MTLGYTALKNIPYGWEGLGGGRGEEDIMEEREGGKE